MAKLKEPVRNLYKSHKTVEAYKIKDVLQLPNGGAKLVFVKSDSEIKNEVVSKDYITKHKPKAGGYFVRYEDGYTSFSPASAFEEGYTKLKKYWPIITSVYPSNEPSIYGCPDDDYNGAHSYGFKNCVGFVDGETKYVESMQSIQFVKKEEDGSMTPGLQSEQLVLALIDRHEKLNAKYPSKQHAKAMKGLKMFLDAQKARVDDRIKRGVMGDLKK